MWIRISSWQIDDLGLLSSGTVTSWGRWHFGQRWRPLWSRLSASVGGRCACSLASPPCLRIFCRAIWARKESGGLVLTKHSRVSFYCILHPFMPRKLNTPHLLLSDLGARCFNQELRFLYCSARKAFFGHVCNIQGQAHVGLFQLYPTSLPCQSSRHAENQEKISCCL